MRETVSDTKTNSNLLPVITKKAKKNTKEALVEVIKRPKK
jgi:hypothetical protein